MKNSNIFPFERNHYYYGKLLSVEDFELEQRYMNNKRRLLNRFYHGMGVVFGMNVVVVDDRTICVKPGYALDSGGREVLLTTEVTKKLSHIDGFESFQDTEQSYAYLCAEYDELENEVVYNGVSKDRQANGGGDFKGNEYNKHLETCRLFISCHEPLHPEIMFHTSVYESRTVVYAGNGIRISHVLPRFVEAGEEFELAVEIENMGQQQGFAFSYELELQYMKYQNSPRLRIDFDEKLMEKAHIYRKTYLLKAQEATQATAFAKVSGNIIKIVAMNQVTSDTTKEMGQTKTFVTYGNSYKHGMNYFYENEMERVLESIEGRGIYLAKIFMVMEEGTYAIHHMEPMPFGQYIWSTRLGLQQYQLLKQEVGHLKDRLAHIGSKASGEEQLSGGQRNISYGSYLLEIGKQKGKAYLSEEIPHGLGIGEVGILLGIGGMNHTQSEVVWGSLKVFDDSIPKVELAAKVYKDKGTFIIGAKHTDTGKGGQYTIYWRAEKDPDSIMEASKEKAIVISPNFLNVKVRESVYIEAECRNMKDKRLKWSVEKYGGIIDKNGLYTAPDREGIYEITVSSFVYPDVSASIYIVVREEMEEEGKRQFMEGQGNSNDN